MMCTFDGCQDRPATKMATVLMSGCGHAGWSQPAGICDRHSVEARPERQGRCPVCGQRSWAVLRVLN